MKLVFDTYKTEYDAPFKQLNLHWLEQYFVVEPHDDEVLSDPYRFIIEPGGDILVVLLEEKVAGVVALMPDENGVFEMTKMAVDSNLRGQKIGQKLLQYTLDFARAKGLDQLILYSNRKLGNAIYLYRKFGFEEIPLETPNPYERADIKMKIKL
ncbi:MULTISPECIES: GNAT family N-acetyltransferase [Leeuwenhoekiella]|jgi:ribosomal protein S18 acetylase RimI-like enzyme|uniref:GNAT family N-acetyltransferase n=1 Tax=Leeuwenhoekiella TaxID=283735 RepID=UPI000C3ACA95|nr:MULTISPECIES: GNAT family N-acetyltransferase [Leeuwenhoekiella]MAO42279.1 GNAT family N-acetyltransferase [Leeuwenhoekiella sp.]HBT08672.1 GNAT family N-acetyltransferase [Leeuwenhoekiella sp.]HCW65175.1 GNAT family N-acetyltransferase [Leeuwenhoekiella sp.]|tara:strand:+ start:2210 stop:2671 length:462 start_codon:yes stop_codon:yes gene_type:complete